ncbi:exopolysaccharide phosphotransferase [Actinoplanes sp. OR16]|uniref:stealth family protein n=1 Tax=Actinoplanes sp. OR16 TaxID=946334 RepID=UPI000F6EBC69|nr:stealth family protein [Actinoplanes sp. OR16]BBH65264.1 exopolysaccharide phosphotransferase [Actinoplanes sp. OR16]
MVVPQRMRQGVKERLSPELYAFLTKRLTQGGPITRGADAVQVSIAKSRFARFLKSDKFVLAHSDQGLAVAQVVEYCTPLHARRANLEAVTRVLDDAGVPYFAVRGFDDLTSSVAVPEKHRRKALAALAAASGDTPTYVAEVADNRVGKMRLAASARSWEQFGRARIVRFARFLTDPTGSIVLGLGSGCDIEFWSEQDGLLHAPRPNRAADEVAVDGPLIPLPERSFTRLASATTEGTREYETRPELVGELLEDVTFPIDLVYTWVDGEDPVWRARRDQAFGGHTEALNDQSANESRFISRDELRYSLRSILMFAPWIRRIFLVTDDQVPTWLNAEDPRITVVSHKELFAGRGTLPTFNSHAIESQLHQIEGLAEHFIYCNDDVFFGRPLTPHDFYQANGMSKIFLSRAKVGPGPVDVDNDIPSTAAGKNNRRIIEREFGRQVTFKMKHVPHALRRSVLAEIAEKYAEELTATSHHQFRHPADVSPTSSLYQYYAFLSQRAVVADIRYMYVDLAARETPSVLRLALAKRHFDVFCVNDTDGEPEFLAQQHAIMHGFLSAYFPVPGPWERSDQSSYDPAEGVGSARADASRALVPKPRSGSTTPPSTPAAGDPAPLAPGSHRS